MEQHEPIIPNDRYVSNYRKGSNQNKQAVLKTNQNILKLKKTLSVCFDSPSQKKSVARSTHFWDAKTKLQHTTLKTADSTVKNTGKYGNKEQNI